MSNVYCTTNSSTKKDVTIRVPPFEKIMLDEDSLATIKGALDVPSVSQNSTRNDFVYGDIKRDIICNRATCITWLFTNGLLAFPQKCTLCENPMKLIKGKGIDGVMWRCSKQRSGDRHYKRISVRAGSWFEKSKLSLETIVELTYMWVRQYPTFLVRQELHISRETQLGWFSFCRDACETYIEELSHPVGGPNTTVEVEATKLSNRRREFQKEKFFDGYWVLGGIEHHTADVFLVLVEDRLDETLYSIVTEWIKPGSTVICSCQKFCKRLKNLEFTDLTVKYSKDFYDACSTRYAKMEWRKVEKDLLSCCASRKSHYSDYLAEYLWRIKVHNSQDKFLSFLDAVRYVFPVNDEA